MKQNVPKSASEIARIEGKMLRNYVLSLEIPDRRLFISQVIKEIGYPTNRKSFYNWEYGKCMIPSFAKRRIEAIAQTQIFHKVETKSSTLNTEADAV